MRRSFPLLCAVALFSLSTVAIGDTVPKLSVIESIPGPDGGWDLASIDSAARKLYVAHGDAVLSVDVDSFKVTPKLADGKRLHGVVPLPGGKLLSTNGGDNTATIFEAETGKIVASIPTGDKPDEAILDSASGLVLVMNGNSGDATLIDPKAAKAVGSIAIGGTLEAAASDGKGKVFVNIEDRGEVAVLDTAGRKLITRYKLPECEEPSGLAIDPVTGVLVSACANNKAIALRASDGTVLATLPIGGRPDATIFDPQRKLFFIPCGEGSLAIISEQAGAAPAVVGTVTTAPGARTGALDSKTGRLFLPTADFAAPAPGEKRHPVVPGTFRILVVGEK